MVFKNEGFILKAEVVLLKLDVFNIPGMFEFPKEKLVGILLNNAPRIDMLLSTVTEFEKI